MANSGYVLVDCGGLDLNDSTTQSIDGLYDRALEAIASGKPCFVTNCVMSDMPCTPVSVVAWVEGENVVATGHVLRVTIEKDDDVTVVNLVAG